MVVDYANFITMNHSANGEDRRALFSVCYLCDGGYDRQHNCDDYRSYRYLLDITWDHALPIMTTIALNPSTATHLVNDATIRRGIGFAKSFGCGGYRMLNAFAWRATDRRELRRAHDPVGPLNTLEFLREMATELTIACWGGTIQERQWKHWYRGHEIAEAIPNLMCLQKTSGGHPTHPLYLPGMLRPVPFSY